MKNLPKNICLALYFIITVCCFNSCHTYLKQSPIEKDGKLCGVTRGVFRYRFWNYYERGISFADCKYWQEAEADFREALKQWGKDKRRTKTYGWHVTDYFPHRELGITLFYQKQYQEAMRELEISLSTEKSAKAEFYLDKARKIWIENNHLDAENPEISIQNKILNVSQSTALNSIESPILPALTNAGSIVVTGTATDDTFVKEIRINDKPIRIDLAEPQISFETEVLLNPGENDIIAEVRDLTGKTCKIIQKIICDRTGPVLNIDGLVPADVSTDRYVLQGYVYDDNSGIKEIRINNETIASSFPSSGLGTLFKEIILHHSVMLPDTSEKVVITAEDQAGNQTLAEIYHPAVSIKRGVQGLLAQNISSDMLLASSDIPVVCDQKPASSIQKPASPQRGFSQDESKPHELGNYHALIIGINEYAEWKPLETAVNDADALRKILTDRYYGFSLENIIFRTDKAADRTAIINDLKQITGRLKENDNLLIYFAGHGALDKGGYDGYWIPADGKKDDSDTWISYSDIRDIVGSEKGKNIIVIADACYSGAIWRENPLRESKAYSQKQKSVLRNPNLSSRGKSSSDEKPPDWKYQDELLDRAGKKSRQAITSGGLEPVADQGIGGHSLFAYYFLDALQKNNELYIDFEKLMIRYVWEPVDKYGQRINIARFFTPADKDGQFVLALNDDVKASLPEKSDIRAEQPEPDTTPPVIETKEWDEKRTVFIDQAFMEINIHDESEIHQVIVNNEKIMKKRGRNLHFNHHISLNPGDNTIIIECADAHGNRSEKEIQIHRKIQKIFEIGSRMSVLMSPLRFTESRKPIIETLLSGYLNESRRFNMVLSDSENKDLEGFKNLQGLSDFLMTGTVDATENTLQITVSILDTVNSQIVTVQDVYEEDTDPEIIRKLCAGLVVKLCDALPLTEGKIVKIKGKSDIIINLGMEDHIKKGMHLIFFKAGEPIQDPDTKEILDIDTDIIGTARIREPLEKIAYTELIDKEMHAALREGIRVITK